MKTRTYEAPVTVKYKGIMQIAAKNKNEARDKILAFFAKHQKFDDIQHNLLGRTQSVTMRMKDVKATDN